MSKGNGRAAPEVYIKDADGRVVAVSERGVAAEAETGRVAGGGMVVWPSDTSKSSSVVVLVAPSMPERFKAFEVTGEGAFLIRRDDVRCAVNCDPIMADGLGGNETIKVTEASGQPGGVSYDYEVMVYAENRPTMRM